MFSIFRSKESFRIGDVLKVDMHSHILPGIDDGAANVQDSLQLIDGLIGLGYKKLIATPHIMSDHHPNTPQTISRAKALLQQTLDEKGYEIPISYAAEYMLDENFLNLVESGELLTLGSRCILVETMFYDAPPNLANILFELQTRELKPILAHPERYHYLDKKLSKLDIWKDRNCFFQPNALSFTGYYGRQEQENALRLLDAGMVDFIGTDMHHTRHLKNCQRMELPAKVVRKLERIEFKNWQL